MSEAHRRFLAAYPNVFEEVRKYFPDFDYRNPVGDRNVLCDMKNPGNMVGHQQRAFSCWWAIEQCNALDLGLDIGSPRGLGPLCIHIDLFGDGKPHPYYGGGPYLADVVWDAAHVERIFPANTFNFVGSNHSLEHVTAPGDPGIVDVLSSWIRLLRSGGVLAMVIPDNAHFDVMASDKDHRHAWRYDDFRPRVLDHVLARGGVELVEYDTLKNNFSFNVVLRKT